MLCKERKEKDIEKFERKGWVGQLKIDGVRCLAICDGSNVKLIGRSGSDMTKKFSEITESLKGLRGIFDGEILCADNSFEHTQSRNHTEQKLKQKLLRKEYPAYFYVFDILVNKPLEIRLQMLYKANLKGYVVRLEYTYRLQELFEKVKKENKEGIVVKNPESYYKSGRSDNWIKIKNIKSDDLKVTNYSENPAGIRCETNNGIAVQVSGSESKSVKKDIDEKGYSLVEINFLEKTKNGKYRMPTFKERKDV